MDKPTDVTQLQFDRLTGAVDKYLSFVINLDADKALMDIQKMQVLALTRAVTASYGALVEGKQIDAREKEAMARAKMTDEVAYKIEVAKAQITKVASDSLRKKCKEKGLV